MRINSLLSGSLVILFVSIFAVACSVKSEGGEDANELALVEVNGKVLLKEEIDNAIPKGLNPTDSTLAAEAYIKMWIKDELMYEKAKENIADKGKIDELVENYRQSLTNFTYQEQLLKQRLSRDVSENELKAYFEKNPDKFELQANIIKGLFLKVPLTSTRLEDLKKWYQSTSEKSIENIEKYSLENAVIFDLFYDKWVSLDDVMDNIPYFIQDSKEFLRQNKKLEVQDSAYVYMLNIKEYALIGQNAPFEYARGQILDILFNQRREDFAKEIAEDLYNEALKDNKIKFYNKEAAGESTDR